VWRKTRLEDHLRQLGAERKIILKLILNKLEVWKWIVFTWIRYDPVMGFKSWSSELWRCVLTRYHTNIPEDLDPSICTLTTPASRPTLGRSQPPIQWTPGALSLGVKRPRSWSWPLTSIQHRGQECVELYLHSPNTSPWRGAQLKHRDNFTFFTFYTEAAQSSETTVTSSPHSATSQKTPYESYSQWRCLVRFHKIRETSWTPEQLLSSQDVILSVI
jgi:hypothetical protein